MLYQKVHFTNTILCRFSSLLSRILRLSKPNRTDSRIQISNWTVKNQDTMPTQVLCNRESTFFYTVVKYKFCFILYIYSQRGLSVPSASFCRGPGHISTRNSRQSNIGPLSTKINTERLTQLLAYGIILITGSVCWWIWYQAIGIHTFDVNWQTKQPQRCCAQTVMH